MGFVPVAAVRAQASYLARMGQRQDAVALAMDDGFCGCPALLNNGFQFFDKWVIVGHNICILLFTEGKDSTKRANNKIFPEKVWSIQLENDHHHLQLIFGLYY